MIQEVAQDALLDNPIHCQLLAAPHSTLQIREVEVTVDAGASIPQRSLRIINLLITVKRTEATPESDACAEDPSDEIKQGDGPNTGSFFAPPSIE